MSLSLDDSAVDWIFSTPDNATSSMHDAGWHQLANDPLVISDGYYNSTALWTKTPGAAASFVFQGTGISLYSAKTPHGGHMNVTCDWNTTLVQLNQSVAQIGEIVWHFTGLDPTIQHVMKIQLVGNGSINIDQVGISPGPLSGIPPSIPNPLPPAFPVAKAAIVKTSQTTMTDVFTMTMTSTMTETMTMTVSATPSGDSSSSISLTDGALAGIIVGILALVTILSACILKCRRRLGRRDGKGEGLRDLYLPWRLGSKRHPSDSYRTGPNFMQIEDREKGEDFMEEQYETKAHHGSGAILPSIRRLSTLTLGQITISSSQTPRRHILTQFPEPPTLQSIPPLRTQHRNRSLALSLSIDTDTSSIQQKECPAPLPSSRTGSFIKENTTRSIQRQHRTLSGFSTSDFTEDWQEIIPDKDIEKDEAVLDAAAFYTEQFSSETNGSYTSVQKTMRYTEEPDDNSPDTPLLPHSPAVASSNVSLSHYSSAHSHNPRTAKGNKILHSLYSRSSQRSSIRHSYGKLSRRSSTTRTTETRTPISKSSMNGSASTSPLSERYNLALSTLSGKRMPESSVPSPTLPNVPENVPSSSVVGPPSAWNECLVSPPRRASKLVRTQRPAGPRPRSSSNSSVTSKSSSAGDSAHSRTSSRNDKGDMLSIVEEASRSGSLRTSMDRTRELCDLLHD